MKVVLYWALYIAFAANAVFLFARFYSWLKGGRTRYKLSAALLLAGGFVAWNLFFSGVSVRGGYDNSHDFQYLGAEFFNPASQMLVFVGKEASPQIADAFGDLLSGYSLAAVPVKNVVLIFASAALVFFCLRVWGLGPGGAAFGFLLYYFNFLAALNGKTVSTTPANMFYLCSALYAASRFDLESRDLKGLAWALAAFFLVLTSRYELSFMPGSLLAVSLVRPGGAFRGLLCGRNRFPAWALLAAAAGLCAAWIRVLAGFPYNGLAPTEMMRLLAHLELNLLERNLRVFMPLPGWAFLSGLAVVFAAALSRAAEPSRRGVALLFWGTVSAWALFMSAIFFVPEHYPLHFMRHNLYFFVPFVFMAAGAWDAVFPAGRGYAARGGGAALVVFFVLYSYANARAALALEPQRRTNDLEWRVMIDASRAWPEGCRLVYGPFDERRDVLRKYFPLVDGRAGEGSCVLKYVPAYCQVFKGPAGGMPSGCTGSWMPSDSLGRPLAEAAFPHRFYTTVADSETRRPVPVRVGFYYSDNPPDRALLLARDAFFTLAATDPAGAEAGFRSALAADGSCGDCRIGLAASLTLGGKEREGLLVLRSVVPDEGNREVISAISEAASGNDAAANALFTAYSRSGGNELYRRLADVFRTAIDLRNSDDRKGTGDPDGPIRHHNDPQGRS